MNTKLIGRNTQQFIRAFQEIHRVLLELSKAQWDEPFPVVLEQAAKKHRVVAALAPKLADLHSLRQRTLNVWGKHRPFPALRQSQSWSKSWRAFVVPGKAQRWVNLRRTVPIPKGGPRKNRLKEVYREPLRRFRS